MTTGRPSYVVGALINNPEERNAVQAFVQQNPNVAKFTPGLLNKLAPQSFKLIKDRYDSYGEELKRYGRKGYFLVDLGNPLFYLFPRFRDIMFHINPKYANF